VWTRNEPARLLPADPSSVVTGSGSSGIARRPSDLSSHGERRSARVERLTGAPAAPVTLERVGVAGLGPVSAQGSEIEVAVLGPTEVRGIARGFSRASALELVVYLALHPAGVPNDTWTKVELCSPIWAGWGAEAFDGCLPGDP